ncbi:MAG: TolC family protein [Bacteroidia bacterium]
MIQISERKLKAGGSALAAMLFFILFSPQIQAQKQVSLDSCIAMALRSHPAAGSAELHLSAAVKEKAAASDIGKTDFDLMAGQYNSIENDLQFTVNQSIPFPGLMLAQSKLLKSEVQLAGYRRDVTLREISRQTRVLWFQTSIARRRVQLADSLWNTAKRLMDIADLRYRTGESALVEKLILEQKAAMIESAKKEATLELASFEKQLGMLCGTPTPVSVLAISASRDVISGIQADRPVWQEHPNLQMGLAESERAQNQLSLERMKLFPDFRLGYFNQSMSGIMDVNGSPVNFTRADRFSGYTAGISVPLWFVPQKARVSSARLRAEASSKSLENTVLAVSMQYEALLMKFKTQSLRLELLEQKQLNVSETITQKSMLAWQQGEASYLELLYTLEQQYQIQNEWLNALLELNDTAASIKYFQTQ